MKRSRLGNWLLGCLLTCGFASVWSLIAGSVGDRFSLRSGASQQLGFEVFQGQPRPDEKFMGVLPSGEPVITISRFVETPNVGWGIENRYESLDGQPMTVDQSQYLESLICGNSQLRQRLVLGHSFSEYQEEHLLANLELPPDLRCNSIWSVDPTGDGSPCWYFVWPRGTNTTGYFACYHPGTKRSQAFLGTNGWNATVPALADQFPARSPVDGRFAELIGAMGDHQGLGRADQPAFVPDASNRGHVVLWFLTPDRSRLLSIDLTEALVPSSQSVRVARDFGDDRPLSVTVPRERRRSDQTLLPPARCVLTFADRIELTNHSWEVGRIVRLPDELRGKPFWLHETQAGLVLQTNQFRRAENVIVHSSSLLWLSDKGEVTRRESFETESEGWASSWTWCASQGLSLMPVAPLWDAALAPFWYGTWSQNAMGYKETDTDVTWSRYPQMFAHYFETQWLRRGWWALLTCGGAGAICASLCWRRERSRGASRAELIAWPTLVFLFGPAGWLGYLTHRTQVVADRANLPERGTQTAA